MAWLYICAISRCDRIVSYVSLTPNTPDLITEADQVPAEPPILRAGDSWQWRRVFPGYLSGQGWTLQYALNCPGVALFQFPAGVATPDADGAAFDVALTSAQTTAIAPGTYDIYAVLANATTTPPAQQTLELESVEVKPAIAGVELNIDTRSFAKKTVDALKAAIQGDTSAIVQEYEIHGRKVQYMNRLELEKLLSIYEQRYRQEQIKAGEFVPKRTARISFGCGS